MSVLEKGIYGVNHHHGFGVECHCDLCRAEANEKMLVAKFRPRKGLIRTNSSWYDRAVEILHSNGYTNQPMLEAMLSRYISSKMVASWDRRYIELVIAAIGFPPEPRRAPEPRHINPQTGYEDHEYGYGDYGYGNPQHW